MSTFGELKKGDKLFMYDESLDCSYEGYVIEVIDDAIFYDGWKNFVIGLYKDDDYVSTISCEQDAKSCINGSTLREYVVFREYDAMVYYILNNLKNKMVDIDKKISKWAKHIT